MCNICLYYTHKTADNKSRMTRASAERRLRYRCDYSAPSESKLIFRRLLAHFSFGKIERKMTQARSGYPGP